MGLLSGEGIGMLSSARLQLSGKLGGDLHSCALFKAEAGVLPTSELYAARPSESM